MRRWKITNTKEVRKSFCKPTWQEKVLGQGREKGEEWRRKETGTSGFSHFTPRLCVMVEYVAERHNDQLFLTSKWTVYLANYFSNLKLTSCI